ncbi:hypothetical protein [Mariniblastus fucicola]|uniref:Uncharacterized protein n=1 Tax=Mariniblastus fucicola TaxID=980251 RepID=A0A5B9P9Q5_9BACT|nr:hypothetical protein [Mariniblastus fucicola]QEG22189.1 hypothetical protein MFFC18_20500 [Mariniblastus fucicola]
MSNPYESPESMTTNANAADWMAQSPSDPQTVAAAVQQYFLGEGYRMEDGNPVDAIYGIGNNLLRILFGAFVKRYRFKVQVVPVGTGSQVSVEKGMSGVMGGAIGYAKMKKELNRIREGVRNSIQ